MATKNKYITRKVFTISGEESIERVLGFINKELETTSINLPKGVSLTLPNKEVNLDIANMTLTIKVKQDNAAETKTVKVYEKESGQYEIEIDTLNTLLKDIGFEMSDDTELPPLSLAEKAAMIEKTKFNIKF